jgi:ribosomal protein S27E
MKWLKSIFTKKKKEKEPIVHDVSDDMDLLSLLNNDGEFGSSHVQVPTDEWIQYIAYDPAELRVYVSGKRAAVSNSILVANGLISQIAGEVSNEEDELYDDEYPALSYLYTAAENGYLPIHFSFYDVELCSTLFNGLLPDGTKMKDESEMTKEEQLDYYKNIKFSLVDYLSKTDSTPEEISKEHIEYRMYEYSHFFNVTCDKCGTPHNFKNDVPLTNLRCTLCDHTLVFYYSLPEEDQYKALEKINQMQ